MKALVRAETMANEFQGYNGKIQISSSSTSEFMSGFRSLYPSFFIKTK